MNRKTLGLISFGIIIFILYAFGIDVFVGVWSFPGNRAVPLMVISLVGTGIYATIRLGFPQLKYIRHGINVTRGIYDNPKDEGDLNHFRALIPLRCYKPDDRLLVILIPEDDLKPVFFRLTNNGKGKPDFHQIKPTI